jgi:hypothetical protein
MTVKQFGGALAQVLTPGNCEFVHQGTMFFNRNVPGVFLASVFFTAFTLCLCYGFEQTNTDDDAPVHGTHLGTRTIFSPSLP